MNFGIRESFPLDSNLGSTNTGLKDSNLRNPMTSLLHLKTPFLSFQDVTKSKLENFKYYTSLMLGTLCIVCIFAFLFLVPFVLDPAISTLMHEFVDSPVTCRVSQVEVKHGKSNCKWSSCREGCTADMFQCYQVRKFVLLKCIFEEIVNQIERFFIY